MSKRAAPKNKKFSFKGFENLHFTEAEQDAITTWLSTFKDSLEDCIVVLAEAGYKVGMSYDDYDGVYQIALTCKDPTSTYHGWCFTLKHSDMSKAVMVVRHVYDKYLKEELWEVATKNNQYDW